MMPTLAALALAAASSAVAQSHDVDHRHDQATGVAHQASRHRFRLTAEGGSIRLEVTDARQLEARDRIRVHLRTVARAFANGDFSLPTSIHAQVPPGVEVMKARRTSIRYVYSDTRNGGNIRIATGDAAARDAVHAFLRFQISDHRTGDPTE